MSAFGEIAAAAVVAAVVEDALKPGSDLEWDILQFKTGT
jgi:hypothetical protein